MKLAETIDHLIFFHISHYEQGLILEWHPNGKRAFPIDIITAKQGALDNIFKHLEGHERKLVYIRYGSYYYILASEMSVQYQVLEAIIEGLHQKFEEMFAGIPPELLVQKGQAGFTGMIPEVIASQLPNLVKGVRARCAICNQTYKIFVKRSLITNAEHYPVSLVYFHEGHGLLLYLDADFQIRGAELVSITG